MNSKEGFKRRIQSYSKQFKAIQNDSKGFRGSQRDFKKILSVSKMIQNVIICNSNVVQS